MGELVTHGCNSLLADHTWCLVGKGICILAQGRGIAEKQNRRRGLPGCQERSIVEGGEVGRLPVEIGA